MRTLSAFVAMCLAVSGFGCGPDRPAAGPEVSGSTVTGVVLDGGKPFKLVKNETVNVSFVGQAQNESLTGIGQVSDVGTFEIKGPSGKGLPAGTYKAALSSMIYNGDGDRFEGKFDAAATPLSVELGPSGTLQVEIDVGSRKVRRK